MVNQESRSVMLRLLVGVLSLMPDLIAVISGLLPAVESLFDRKSQRDESTQKAILDLTKALRHTEMYIRNLEEKHGVRDHLDAPRPRSWQIECELADLWKEAALSCRDIDRNISRMANAKAGFWENVTQWKREDVTRHGIAIIEARTKIEHLVSKLGYT